MKSSSMLFIFIATLFSNTAFAIIPMTDDEIRKMLVEGEINKYERGQCPREFLQRLDAPETVSAQRGSSQATESTSESKVREQESSRLFGPGTTFFGRQQYEFGTQSAERETGTQSGSTSESRSKTINPAQCVCPCPFSRDLQGKNCGSNSAYVRTNGDNICYPDDIPTWVIDEYRIQHDIPRK